MKASYQANREHTKGSNDIAKACANNVGLKRMIG